MSSLPLGFVTASADYLRGVYLPRLERALAILPPADLWWRPHSECIAFGTILVHLEGNVRQWILAGVGGQDDDRARDAEFAANAELESRSGDELLAALRATIEAAATAIESLSEARLAETVTVQGYDNTVQTAILHVVEHFSWHTGQAVWVAKARGGAGHGLSFYDDTTLA
ncbi:MAG: putative damage-inducible protein DinB [Planctomycetota bacterium]